MSVVEAGPLERLSSSTAGASSSLSGCGFASKLAERIATTSVDLHELEHLIGRGCPRGTAYRILRP